MGDFFVESTILSVVLAQKAPQAALVATCPKTSMKPENHLFRKGNSSSTPSFLGSSR